MPQMPPPSLGYATGHGPNIKFFFCQMYGYPKFTSIDAVRLEIFCKEISTEKRKQAHLPKICIPVFFLFAKESYNKR